MNFILSCFYVAPKKSNSCRTPFTLFAGMAQFERDLIAERTKEGIIAARQRGKNPGRPPVDPEKIKYALYLVDQGSTITEAAEKAGISRMTLYRKAKDEQVSIQE